MPSPEDLDEEPYVSMEAGLWWVEGGVGEAWQSGGLLKGSLGGGGGGNVWIWGDVEDVLRSPGRGGGGGSEFGIELACGTKSATRLYLSIPMGKSRSKLKELPVRGFACKTFRTTLQGLRCGSMVCIWFPSNATILAGPRGKWVLTGSITESVASPDGVLCRSSVRSLVTRRQLANSASLAGYLAATWQMASTEAPGRSKSATCAQLLLCGVPHS